MVLYDLGPGVHLLHNEGTGIHIMRGARQVRQSAPEQTAVGVQISGSGVLAVDRSQSLTRANQLHVVDVTRPYDFRQSGISNHKVLLIDDDQLALPIDLIRDAATELVRSPLYGLVSAHLTRLCEDGELPAAARQMVGQATVELVRALLLTAIADGRQKAALECSLYLRITMYIDIHLHDPTLNAERIAAAHNISIRQLYKLWADANHDLTLSRWIIHKRLERARNQLADLDPELASIAGIARGSGFVDMSHFSRRFRETYGMSPRQWRLEARTGMRSTMQLPS